MMTLVQTGEIKIWTSECLNKQSIYWHKIESPSPKGRKMYSKFWSSNDIAIASAKTDEDRINKITVI